MCGLRGYSDLLSFFATKNSDTDLDSKRISFPLVFGTSSDSDHLVCRHFFMNNVYKHSVCLDWPFLST